MVELEALVRQYGYAFVLLGSLLEGETTVALGGLAAHQGYMKLVWVFVVATVGATLGDQIWFHLGRARGKAFLEKRPRWAPMVARFEALFDRWDVVLILVFRFFYGMRLAGAVAMGTSNISVAKFTVFNTLGAAIWAAVVAGGGYVLGRAMQRILGNVAVYEEWIFGILLACGLGVAVWHRMRRRRMARAST